MVLVKVADKNINGHVNPDPTLGISPFPYTAVKDFTVDAGTDRLLVVNAFYKSTNKITGITFGGAILYEHGEWEHKDPNAAIRYSVWYLLAPVVGNSTTLELSFSEGSQNVALYITAYTGANFTTPLKSISYTKTNSPNSGTMTIGEGSLLMSASAAQFGYKGVPGGVSIDGTVFSEVGPPAYNFRSSISGSQFNVSIREDNLPAGTKTVITTSTAAVYLLDNTIVEIVNGDGSGGRRRVILCH